MRIGILAVQGAFLEHEQMLDRLQCPHFEIRQKRDLEGPIDGLILPGGESTAMKKLLKDLDLFIHCNITSSQSPDIRQNFDFSIGEPQKGHHFC